MKTFFLEKFVRFWRLDDSVITDSPDLIVPVSYTTLRDRLTNATERITVVATEYQRMYPKAFVVMSPCAYMFPGSANREWEYRKAIFETCQADIVRARVMNNSVEEVMAIVEVIKDRGIKNPHVLVVTGEMHMRAVKFIWKKIMPEARVSIKSVPYWYEYQPEHFGKRQRSAGMWVYASVVRQIILRTLGVDWFVGRHHPVIVTQNPSH
ncbi:MAG TPA: hypothetical protein PLB51_01705 [Candidatus Paceibacterota bacterium]|nr:hypothetical protein [Candidatus Paceibacterota bacterium]